MSENSLVDRDDLRQRLALFGIEYQDRMLRYAMDVLGVKPTRYESLPAPKRGRRALYDPIVAWVVASAYLATDGRIRESDVGLEEFRVLVREARSIQDADLIPGFMEDDEFAAQLLLIGSPDLGMDPLRLITLVRANPNLLDLSAWGGAVLEVALSAYKEVYAGWLGREPLVRQWYHDPIDRDSLREQFAHELIEEMASTFRGLDIERRAKAGEDIFGDDSRRDED